MRHFYFNKISIFSPNYICIFELNSDEKRSEQDGDIENIYIYIDIGKSFQSDNRIRFEHRFDIGEFFPFVCFVQQAKKKKIPYMELVRCDSRGSSN